MLDPKPTKLLKQVLLIISEPLHNIQYKCLLSLGHIQKPSVQLSWQLSNPLSLYQGN